MNIAIVQFPGSNCERETMLAVKRAGMNPVAFLWNEPHSILRDMDGYVIVGGFSYEDRSRAGIIAALDPVMREIAMQSEQGKPVLGICNGAQILVETGLVPGLKNNQLGMALTDNKRMVDGKILGTGFYNNWIHMRPCDRVKTNAFTRYLTKESILHVPVAHAEGRFVMPEELLSEVEAEGLNVFQYCDEDGNIIDNFPINPNGSLINTAAIMNRAGNVMAMMPHPERTLAGDPIFHSMRDYILEKKEYRPQHLSYTPNSVSIEAYRKKAGTHELLVKLVITDNQALTVQNSLRQNGIPVKVSRLMHWQIDCDFPELIEQIKKTGVLFNERKEYLVSPEEVHKTSSLAYLVQSREDLMGQQKMQMLEDHFSITGLKGIQQGVVWFFEPDEANAADFKEALLKTNIFFNQHAHECYEYKNS